MKNKHSTSLLVVLLLTKLVTTKDQLLFSFNIMTPGASQMEGTQLSAIGRRQMYLNGFAVNKELGGGSFISTEPEFQWNGTHN